MDRKRALAISAAIAMVVIGVTSAVAGVVVRSGSTADIATTLSGGNREQVVVEITEYVNGEQTASASPDAGGATSSTAPAAIPSTTPQSLQNQLAASVGATVDSVVSQVGSRVGSAISSYLDDDDDDEDDDDEDDEDDEDGEDDDD